MIFDRFEEAEDLEEVRSLGLAGEDHKARRYSSCGLATVRLTVEDMKDDLERAIAIVREECEKQCHRPSPTYSAMSGR